MRIDFRKKVESARLYAGRTAGRDCDHRDSGSAFAAGDSGRSGGGAAAQCINNLKQLGIASHLHLDTYGFFPSAGWGDWWVGCPDQGAGKNQPGSWAYQLLPFIEEAARAQVGQGFKCGDPKSRAAIGQMVATHVSVFYCPTRRTARPYPWTNPNNYNFDPPPMAGKSDYAGNMGGDFASIGMGTDVGPSSIEEADNYGWIYSGDAFVVRFKARYPAFKGMSGVIFQRSEVKISQITDGTRLTRTCSAKRISIRIITKIARRRVNDDQSMYNGYDKDNIRGADIWILALGAPTILRFVPQCPIRPGVLFDWSFGGPHSGGWIALFCDDSVRFLSYDMKPELHQNFGSRHDGRVTSLSDL